MVHTFKFVEPQDVFKIVLWPEGISATLFATALVVVFMVTCFLLRTYLMRESPKYIFIIACIFVFCVNMSIFGYMNGRDADRNAKKDAYAAWVKETREKVDNLKPTGKLEVVSIGEDTIRYLNGEDNVVREIGVGYMPIIMDLEEGTEPYIEYSEVEIDSSGYSSHSFWLTDVGLLPESGRVNQKLHISLEQIGTDMIQYSYKKQGDDSHDSNRSEE